jgi:hypothetical protein
MLTEQDTMTHNTFNDATQRTYLRYLKAQTAQDLDAYLGLSETVTTPLVDALRHRIEILRQQIPHNATHLLEVGPATGYSGQVFAQMGHKVVTLAPQYASSPPLRHQDHTLCHQTFEDFSNAYDAPVFDLCFLQEELPSQDGLDLFERIWKLLSDDGVLVLLQEFFVKQSESAHRLNPPVMRHIIRQAQDCGLRLEREQELTPKAINTLHHHQKDLSTQEMQTSQWHDQEYRQYYHALVTRLDEYKRNLRCYKLLKFRKVKQPRWRIRLAREEDLSALQALFQEAFEQEFSTNLWIWKYGSNRGMGVLAEHQGKIVAHYGGIKRKLSYQGNLIDGVQIADVMVSPKERGILTRKGAFFRVAAAFPEYFVGYGAPTLIGFGFPNMRHMRIAETMNLYSEVGRIEELVWKTTQYQNTPWVHNRDLSIEKDHKIIDKLWQKMLNTLPNSIIGIRNANYLDARYRHHPQIEYRMILVYRRPLKTPIGIAVLHHIQPEICRLIDLIGPAQQLPAVLNQALGCSASWGCCEMLAWGSEQTVAALNSTGAQRRSTDIGIPTSIWTEGPSPETLKGKWWLMFGDTDFN